MFSKIKARETSSFLFYHAVTMRKKEKRKKKNI